MRSLSCVVLASLALICCGRSPHDGIAITAVELRSAPKLEFLRARVGMKFLEVRFELDNGTEEPLTLTALDFSLRDTAGKLYPFSAQVLDMGQPRGTASVEVQPGMHLLGSVVFQIPKKSEPAELIYRQDLEGGLVVRLTSSG